MTVTFLLYIEFASRILIRREDDDAMVLIITLLFISFSPPKMLRKSEVCLGLKLVIPTMNVIECTN